MCDGGGKPAARLASEEMGSSRWDVSCRCLPIEYQRQCETHAEARPANDPAQFVPVRAGVCGVAFSRGRMRLSQERML